MSEYRYKAIGLIASHFEEKGFSYYVLNKNDREEVWTNLNLEEQPTFYVKFISSDDDMDVQMRLYNILNDTPESKRNDFLDLCNQLTNEYGYFKFLVDSDGDVSMEYDFPIGISEASVGPVAFEMVIRMMSTLRGAFPRMMAILYDNN